MQTEGIVGVFAILGLFFFLMQWLNIYKKYKSIPKAIFNQDSRFGRELKNQVKFLSLSFNPTPWALGAHAQTIVSAIFRKGPNVHFRSEWIGTFDNCKLRLDWVIPEKREEQKHENHNNKNFILLILHGLTGGSSDNYIRHYCECARDINMECVVMNYRGCNNSKLENRRVYSASATEDLDSVVQHVSAIRPDKRIIALGASLGSIILLKYLSKVGVNSKIASAISICNPWDLTKASASLETEPNLSIYNKRLANNLKSMIRNNSNVFLNSANNSNNSNNNKNNEKKELLIDLNLVERARTIREIDSLVICPMFNFKDVWEYYDDASSSNYIDKILVPTLCINAEDDPFGPIDGIPINKIETKCKDIVLILTKTGGHLGFATSLLPFGKSWIDQLLPEYLNFVANYLTK